jgi:hypothetical protein
MLDPAALAAALIYSRCSAGVEDALSCLFLNGIELKDDNMSAIAIYCREYMAIY